MLHLGNLFGILLDQVLVQTLVLHLGNLFSILLDQVLAQTLVLHLGKWLLHWIRFSLKFSYTIFGSSFIIFDQASTSRAAHVKSVFLKSQSVRLKPVFTWYRLRMSLKCPCLSRSTQIRRIQSCPKILNYAQWITNAPKKKMHYYEFGQPIYNYPSLFSVRVN